MNRTLLPALAVALVASSLRADQPPPPSPRPGLLAHRLWAVTEIVLDNHVEPPVRQQMLLAATRLLLERTEVIPPPDLTRRVSRLTTEEEFVAFLEELWPRGEAGHNVDSELEANVVHGLLRDVPGEATFLPADELKVMEQINGNRYVGTGIQIRMDAPSNSAQIVIPFVGGPARKAGAKPGDLIVEVDGENVQGGDGVLRKVVNRLRGEEGTEVSMVVCQPGGGDRRTLKMVRSVIPFETAVGYRHVSEAGWDYRPDPSLPIAYVRLGGLRSSTLHELRALEPRLRAEGFRALVLDLRFGGGTAHDAALVADGLLDGGLIWRVRNARGGVQEYRADRDCLFRGWPMAVLVTQAGRADGSEFLAAALQDNRRAVVVGDPLRGDGYVREFVSLPDGQGSLNLSTGIVQRSARVRPAAAERVEPGPRTGHAFLVEPDHRAPLDRKQQQALQEWFRSQENAPAVPAPDKAPEDPQLTRALEVLRAALKPAEAL